MVFLLVGHVFPDGGHVGNTSGEDAVAALPCEAAVHSKLGFQPFGRRVLHILYHLTHRGRASLFRNRNAGRWFGLTWNAPLGREA